MADRVDLLEAVDDERLLGAVFKPLPRQRDTLALLATAIQAFLCLGRRSGKSTLAGLLLAYRATLCPHLRAHVLAGEVIRHVVVANNREQAGVTFHAARRFILASPVLRRLVERDNENELWLRGGHVISAFVCSSRTGRGYPIATLILDEFAFFTTTDDGPAAAQNVYRAMTPSLCSSARTGVSSWRRLRTAATSSRPCSTGPLSVRRRRRCCVLEVAVVHLPTAAMRPDIPSTVLAQESLALGESADAEFGVQFLGSGSALVSESDIRSCVRSGGDLDPRELGSGVRALGVDLAWRRDRSTGVVGCLDRDGRVEVAAVRMWDPPSDLAGGTERHQERVIRELADLSVEYDAPVFCDTYESATVRARFAAHGVACETVSMASSKADVYQELARRIRGGMVLFPDHPTLIAELRRLRIRYGGARPRIENPRAGGGHGDVAQALAMAVGALALDDDGDAAAGASASTYADSLGYWDSAW